MNEQSACGGRLQHGVVNTRTSFKAARLKMLHTTALSLIEKSDVASDHIQVVDKLIQQKIGVIRVNCS